MYLESLLLKYKADVAVATANLNNYLSNGVGVAEHPDIISSLDMLVAEIAAAKEKLKVVARLKESTTNNQHRWD
jgi:uncharacterized protein YaeQ